MIFRPVDPTDLSKEDHLLPCYEDLKNLSEKTLRDLLPPRDAPKHHVSKARLLQLWVLSQLERHQGSLPNFVVQEMCRPSSEETRKMNISLSQKQQGITVINLLKIIKRIEDIQRDNLASQLFQRLGKSLKDIC